MSTENLNAAIDRAQAAIADLNIVIEKLESDRANLASAHGATIPGPVTRAVGHVFLPSDNQGVRGRSMEEI